MRTVVYLRMKSKETFPHLQTIYLKDIVYISAHPSLKKDMSEIPIYKMTEKDQDFVVIDSFLIAETLNDKFPGINVQFLGPSATIIQVVEQNKNKQRLFACFVWILLFIGSSMTIMNFHYDVSMEEVHEKVHFLITGENKSLLWIQIPYSFGLGIGILLFFNRWFKKKINEEPSPLELELFNYEQNIYQYIAEHENQLND